MRASEAAPGDGWRPLLLLAAAFVGTWWALLTFPALRTVLFLGFFALVRTLGKRS